MPSVGTICLTPLEFVSASPMGEHQAFLCKGSGRIYWRSDVIDQLEETSNDVKGSQKAVASLVRGQFRRD